MDDLVSYELLFRRIDDMVKAEELFRNPDITLPMLADIARTNRTYASRAICFYYKGFRDYVNTLRIEAMLDDLFRGVCDQSQIKDNDEFANRYGFRNFRSLNRITFVYTGYTFAGLIKEFKL